VVGETLQKKFLNKRRKKTNVKGDQGRREGGASGAKCLQGVAVKFSECRSNKGGEKRGGNEGGGGTKKQRITDEDGLTGGCI